MEGWTFQKKVTYPTFGIAKSLTPTCFGKEYVSCREVIQTLFVLDSFSA